MIENLLHQAATGAGFKCVLNESPYAFFENTEQSERYLVIASLTHLPAIDQVHENVIEHLPTQLANRPSFSKNCDLVIVHKVDQLADYNSIEEIILSYEEDPFHFKKYFLYFTDAEAKLVNNKNFDDIASAVSDPSQFSNYKTNPLIPSLYALAARIFIKVPFLQLPRAEKELVPLTVELEETLTASGMDALWHTLTAASLSDGLDIFVQEIVNEELEIIKNTNPRV